MDIATEPWGLRPTAHSDEVDHPNQSVTISVQASLSRLAHGLVSAKSRRSSRLPGCSKRSLVAHAMGMHDFLMGFSCCCTEYSVTRLVSSNNPSSSPIASINLRRDAWLASQELRVRSIVMRVAIAVHAAVVPRPPGWRAGRHSVAGADVEPYRPRSRIQLPASRRRRWLPRPARHRLQIGSV